MTADDALKARAREAREGGAATDARADPAGPATAVVESSLGTLTVRAVADGLRRVAWRDGAPDSAGEGRLPIRADFRAGGTDGDPSSAASPARETAVEAARQLAGYLEGERRAFELPLSPDRLPPFRRRVLEELTRIPYGETASYGEIAARCGRPGAARAVGNAVGRNPLPLVLPCHRVIRSDGSPGGYSGGTARKRALLRLEVRAGS